MRGGSACGIILTPDGTAHIANTDRLAVVCHLETGVCSFARKRSRTSHISLVVASLDEVSEYRVPVAELLTPSFRLSSDSLFHLFDNAKVQYLSSFLFGTTPSGEKLSKAAMQRRLIELCTNGLTELQWSRLKAAVEGNRKSNDDGDTTEMLGTSLDT